MSRGAQHSSLEDSVGHCSSTKPTLDEHLEEKKIKRIDFEKEKGVREERELLLEQGSEGFGRGSVPSCCWGG